MSINCRVFRDERGNVSFVNAPNGKKSILFDKLVDMLGGNKNTALNLYALTETEDFKDIVDSKKSEHRAKVLANTTRPSFVGTIAEEVSNTKEGLQFSNFIPNRVISGINQDLVNISNRYKEERGLQTESPILTLSVSESDAMRVADAYDEMEHDPENPIVKEAYDKLIEEIKLQADMLLNAGYKFELSKEERGYKTSSDMIADVRDNKHIFIDPSSENFGTSREFDNNNIGLADSGYKDINGNPLTNVEVIRAVHDIFGHAKFGTQFGAVGEENAWRVHMTMFSPEAQRALTATTRGQNSWVNFGKHMRKDGELLKKGDEGYISPTERPFAEQKIGLLPEWATDNSYGDVVTVEGNTIKPVNKYIIAGEEVYEIADGNAYYDAISSAKKSRLDKSIPEESRDGIQVYVKSAKEYQDIVDKGGKLLISKDGLTGVKIEADGNIGSGFNHSKNIKQNALAPYLIAGIKMGARYAEAFDTYLPKYYSKFGFVASGRMMFDENAADKGWEKSILKTKPDLVFMYFDGGDRMTIEDRVGTFEPYQKTDGEYTDSYEYGVEQSKNSSSEKATLVPLTPKKSLKDEVKEATKKEPVPTMEYKGAKLYSKDRINPFSGKPTGEIELELIKTEERERGQGQAKELLKRFSDYADALGKNAYLAVSPFDNTIDAERLKGLYSSFGFKPISDFEMIRKAKPIRPEGFDSNGEPDVSTLLAFSNSTSDMLSPEELMEAKNTLIGFGVKSSQELKNILERNFIKNGVISFSESILEANGDYNKYEISEILKSSEIQRSIKESIVKLRNMNDFSIDYDINFANPSSSKLNIFGKQTHNNPFIAEKELATELAGEALENVRDFLPESLVNKYDTDPKFKAAIDSLATDYRNIPVKKILGDEIVDQEDTMEGMLKRTLSDDFNESLSNDVAYLNKIKPDMWEDNRVTIANILSGVEREAIKNGIDLRDFSTKAITKPREQILQFLNEMENVLEEQSDENIRYFSESYNNLFEKDKATTQLAKTNSEFDIYLDTDLSEYELFSRFGLVKNTQNVYRETSDISLEELYNNFFLRKSLYPSDINTVEDLKDYVQKNTPKLEVSDFQVDSDNLEKMFLYKTFFKFPMSSKEEVVNIEEAVSITFDPAYLQEDFVKEVAQWIVDTNNKFFKVSERGIELVETDSISKEEAALTIPDSMIERFSEYDKISNNLNLGLKLQEEDYQAFDKESLERLYAINNPDSVPKAKGEYSYVEEGILVTKNEHNNFVRTPMGIYEMIYQMGNLKFFNKLEEANASYKTVEGVKPLSDIDFSKYLYLETSPEVFKESKEYYTKKELKQINDDYFGCQ